MLEKQCFIPEPEEFITETPMTSELKKIKKVRDEEIFSCKYSRIKNLSFP